MANILGLQIPFTNRQNHAAPAVTMDKRKDDPAKQQNEQAVAVLDSFMFRLQGGFDRYNPDILVQRKGAGVYKQMLRDDQVKAAFNMKLGLIIGRSMVFDVRNDAQKECAEFFDRNITDLIRGTWRKAMKCVLMGKAWGYSMSEKVFRADVVDGKNRWVLDRLKAKPWDSFNFITDEYGNITRIEQDQTSSIATMDTNKFIRYVSMPEMDDIYGESDLKAAYRPFWEKGIAQKLWNIYLERSAGGFIMGTPNERLGNLSNQDKATFEKVLTNISGTSGIIAPQGYDLKVEMPRDVRAFEYAIDKRDIQIARALLIPNFLGLTEQGGVGSRAQSEIIFEMFMMLIEEEAEYLADILNEELFAQLAWWNFNLVDYPRAKFIPYTTEQKRAVAQAWIEAVNKGAVTNTLDDEIRTRQMLLYPVPEKDDLEELKKANDEKEKPEPEPDTISDDEEADTPTNQEVKQENKERQQPITIINQYPDFTAAIASGIQPKPVKQDHVEVIDNKEIDYEKPMYVDRIDFASLEQKLDTIDSKFYADLVIGTDRLLVETSAGMEKILAKQGDSKAVDKEKFIKQLNEAISTRTKSRIKRDSQASLKSTYTLGRRLANKALSLAIEKAPEDVKQKIELKIVLTEAKACMDPNWTVAHFIDGISIDAAESWFSSMGFSIAGDLTKEFIDTAVQIMVDGIRDEVSVRDMVKSLGEQLPTIVQSSPKANRARLETIVRTNMSTIFTQAQLAFYADPDLNGFVEALEYSSVLDHRTTIVCERLNGAKYAIDNAIWGHITPPNHYNCRSVLLPITMLDPWRTSTRKYSENERPGVGFGKENFPETYTKG